FTISSSINTTQAVGAGNISAAGLEIQGAGNTTLTNVANDVTTIAGSTSGTVKYVDATALTVGTVTSTGLASAANVKLNTQSGDLTVSQAIGNASTSTVTLQAQSGNVSGAGNITATTLGGNASASLSLTGTGNAAGNVALTAGTGNVAYTSAGS